MLIFPAPSTNAMNFYARRTTHSQIGGTLIEVLVSILILSFGMLALGAMLGFAVQAPKMSAHRSTATNLASAYIERLRANKAEFSKAGSTYLQANTFDFSTTKFVVDPKNACAYPNCTASLMSTADFEEFKVTVRDELPAGGLFVEQDSADTTYTSGNIWILWTEPQTFAAINSSQSDNCPTLPNNIKVTPNCLYMRFKL